MLRRIDLLGLLLATASACAQYRCVESCNVVYTDRPCAYDIRATIPR